MNKAELIGALADKAGITRKDAEKALNAFTDIVCETLKAGDKVQIVNFGTFEVRERKARKGHNPATKKEIDIPATQAAVFKVGKSLKESVVK